MAKTVSKNAAQKERAPEPFPLLGIGCVRMRLEEAGQGLVQ
jgi:hypothetical protein